MSLTSSSATIRVQRIRMWQHGRAVRQMVRAYPPGTDALVDQIRSAGLLRRVAFQWLFLPLYFAREQGWMVPGAHHRVAAIMYLRRNTRQGIRVMHIDDINVDAAYRRHGYAQRLMALAEELARKERRPFLKLAVTVANTPAVTLYRRLGYEDQHHRFLTFTPAPSPPAGPLLADSSLTLRPLRRRAAWQANRRFYRIEMRASAPAVADMLVAYYPRGAGNVRVPKAGERRFAVEHRGEQIGYGDAYRRGAQWHVRLSLQPEAWGTALEWQVIRLLIAAVTADQRHDSSAPVAFHVPSAAHFESLCAGEQSLGHDLLPQVQSYDRMIMVKVVTSGS